MCWAIIACFERVFCCKKKKEKQGWGADDATAEQERYTAKKGTDYEAVKMSNNRGPSWEYSHDGGIKQIIEGSNSK